VDFETGAKAPNPAQLVRKKNERIFRGMPRSDNLKDAAN